MHISIGSSELSNFVTMFVVLLVVLAVIAAIALLITKKREDSKPLQTSRAKVIEKIGQNGALGGWYVLELADGSRRRFRTFNNNLMLANGDEGIVEYKGQTIQSFKRMG